MECAEARDNCEISIRGRLDKDTVHVAGGSIYDNSYLILAMWLFFITYFSKSLAQIGTKNCIHTQLQKLKKNNIWTTECND